MIHIKIIAGDDAFLEENDDLEARVNDFIRNLADRHIYDVRVDVNTTATSLIYTLIWTS